MEFLTQWANKRCEVTILGGKYEAPKSKQHTLVKVIASFTFDYHVVTYWDKMKYFTKIRVDEPKFVKYVVFQPII